MLTPATVTLLWSGYTAITSPTRPRSLPLITLTRSPFRMCRLPFFFSMFLLGMALQHLRCKRDDAHEALFAQLTPNGSEDAGAARLTVALQDHRGILVELDVRAVNAAMLLRGPHDHRLDDLALLDVAAGDGVLDGGDDDVADARVAATRSAEHADAQDLLGTRVVGDLQPRLLLDHPLLSLLRLVSLSAGYNSPRR